MPTTQVSFHTVYYDDRGSGQPVLLLTGLGASRLGWWKQIEPFSRKYRLINIDNRDAGDSALGSGFYTIADMADDTAGVIKNLDLGRTHIVGISMGGMIALELVIRYPEIVDGLVLVSTTAGGPDSVGARPEILALLMGSPEENVEARVRHTYTAIAGPGYMAAHPQDLDRIAEISNTKPMSAEAFQRQLSACFRHFQQGVADRLAQINVPTLVIHGDADPLIPYQNGKYLAEHIKNAQLSTYLGVGHIPMIEASERFNHEVIEFLS